MTEQTSNRREPGWPYLLLGGYLGVVFLKTELISWFRIQEMFRFHAFHMYGIIGGAVARWRGGAVARWRWGRWVSF